ncbi:proton channel OtopLc isoform X2 [Anabrus simplex]|uniref:proton channel OtopLc isoform X2 n=1 Tax=Anabrus simplex TaxID=316456 RepID=UPI0035A313EE
MQRCPYIHEMKERLLSQSSNPDQTSLEGMEKEVLEVHGDPTVGTIVKLNPDGYGSHTSPAHHCSRQHLTDDLQVQLPPKNAKTSLFIILSFIYAKLLVVICIAYVISEVVTHNLPLHYYEGFFTYLYGTSILFLLYVFCFLLQESACCAANEQSPKPVPNKKQKQDAENAKKQKKKKPKDKEKDKEKQKKAAEAQDPAAQKGSTFQGVLRNLRSSKDVNLNDGAESPSQEKLTGGAVDDVQMEAGRPMRKRKTSQNVHSHGSFFLRVGAIAFGLGTMIYNGLECGAFFEIPFNSPCYQILKGINPVLQMIFTFMQMYFIFMNSRLNIHRFKVLARFGLMHVVATNLCVWIRTLVLESLKEITEYQRRRLQDALGSEEAVEELFRGPIMADPNAALATVVPSPSTTTPGVIAAATTLGATVRAVAHLASSTIRTTLSTLETTLSTTTTTTTTALPTTTSTTTLPTTTTTLPTTTITPSTTTATTMMPTTTPAPTTTPFTSPSTTNVVTSSLLFPHLYDVPDLPRGYEAVNGSFPTFESSAIFPAALVSTSNATSTGTLTECGRINIMGTIVQDSAPYLFPFIIEYSLIGAAVIYVMWRHIGRHTRYVTEEDLEHRLEVMLSRRAVAMAQAQQHGRVDCVGASKGLFFGLLLLVGSLICLILFFVLIHHRDLHLLAIYLADVSHCVLMTLSIVAIIVGFIRVQSLKFRAEEQSDLNDILLRVSAFGLFVYAVFSVIAGSLNAFTHEPNLLVMITGLLSVFQVVLQLLFIADVARRRVHLPEHDRSKPGRQVVTFLLICNVTMWVIYTFEVQKVFANPVQLDFYGFLAWAIVQRVTLPLCIFHRFHSAVTLAEIWKTSYKARLE